MKNKILIYSFIAVIMICLTSYAVVKTESAARHRLQFMWGFVTIVGVLVSNQVTIIYNRVSKFQKSTGGK